jgi:hypothetical protein
VRAERRAADKVEAKTIAAKVMASLVARCRNAQ